MVICGDMAQIDLKDKRETGFSFLARLEEQVEGFVTHSLQQNHRHEIVTPILRRYIKPLEIKTLLLQYVTIYYKTIVDG